MVTHMNRKELPIAENIRFLQKSRNYTWAQLAGLIGVKTCALSAWLDGRCRPRIDELLSIADHFDITLDVLVRTNMRKWYVVRTDHKMEKIVEQGPKLVIEK
jgi:transcriptional regulator with XRE-family HTH domain